MFQCSFNSRMLGLISDYKDYRHNVVSCVCVPKELNVKQHIGLHSQIFEGEQYKNQSYIVHFYKSVAKVV